MADNTTPTPGNAALAFHFSPSFDVRAILRDGEPWFVAKDVAEALDYTWGGSRIAHVPEEWRGVTSVVTPSGEQQMAVLSEQGLYFFLGRSDKPKALPFQKWLAGTVLPAIRKTGRYQATPPAAPAPGPEQLNAKELQTLTQLVGLACCGLRNSGAWQQGLWLHLRLATNNPAPQPWLVEHLPILGRELTHVMQTAQTVASITSRLQRAACQRILRRSEAAGPVLAELEAAATAELAQLDQLIHKVPDVWVANSVQALVARKGARA